MKYLIALMSVLVATVATAKENTTARNIEKSFLVIADELATQHLKKGACGVLEAYTFEIAEAAISARKYFDYNAKDNKRKGLLFKLSPNTTKFLADTLVLKEIMNMLDRRDPSTFERALGGVTMYGSAPGAFGNISKLSFKKKGHLTLSTLELLDDEPWTSWNETEGYYSVYSDSRGQVIVAIQVNGESNEYVLQKNYGLGGEWELAPIGTEHKQGYNEGKFTDYPSECDA